MEKPSLRQLPARMSLVEPALGVPDVEQLAAPPRDGPARSEQEAVTRREQPWPFNRPEDRFEASEELEKLVQVSHRLRGAEPGLVAHLGADD